jgi:hypothetical protein
VYLSPYPETKSTGKRVGANLLASSKPSNRGITMSVTTIGDYQLNSRVPTEDFKGLLAISRL